MAVCCCSLAGTAACQHCRNNPFATDVWTNTTETTGTGDYVRTFMVNPKINKTNADRVRSMTDEELAVLCESGCPPRRGCPDLTKEDVDKSYHELCQKCWLDWLKEEVKE